MANVTTGVDSPSKYEQALALYNLNISDAEVAATVKKIIDEKGVMNRSIMDIAGEHEGADGNIIVVSQFTLFASYKKGNRPSWLRAATHDISVPLYEAFIEHLSVAIGRPVGHGEFGADMKVSLTNDGPVTIVMDTKNKE